MGAYSDVRGELKLEGTAEKLLAVMPEVQDDNLGFETDVVGGKIHIDIEVDGRKWYEGPNHLDSVATIAKDNGLSLNGSIYQAVEGSFNRAIVKNNEVEWETAKIVFNNGDVWDDDLFW